ncbi:type I secretion system permease/ATPase [Methylobacterium radiotolerans]|uniref:type I secretion system permease/ATPase n=1 Tax=Methylobacterium radiotolerans TaxID=31998 RepID=UPI0005E5B678|nr:type I secretion system permease/ATPase [Methylobacterium radiotolerans]MBN6823907.1 type I secretion system permease/ATPase [Methylobacterium organophilum]GAN51143.1 type I secretion system ATPase [Methylobacterium sp. ME121]KTS05128.1 type I secretion protein [Methylobacterium radiotolerans]KTS43725.1 type I secretion protein [Methylobacterium radiotolerans]OXE40837.1 type I secretion system permease/ATPase [Methylobacterium radiotolerans]
MTDERVLRVARRREFWSAVRAGRTCLITVMIISGLINLLMLTAPIFMLQVYDRVLPSRSIATLVGLAGITLMLLVIQSIFEIFRARILARFGRLVDERLGPRIFRALLARGAEMPRGDDGPQALRDLDTVRGFVSSMAVSAFFDLPWVPLYVAVCFLFHPWLGAAVAGGALFLCVLTVLTDWASSTSTQEAVRTAGDRRSFTDMAHRTAPLLSALGMRSRMAELWQVRSRRNLDVAAYGNDLAIGFGTTARLLRTVLQSSILGLGAFLVVREEATAGVMLAATILSARALAPVDLAIANWKSFSGARQAWGRLVAFLPRREPAALTPLPAPRESVRVTALSIAAPGTDTLVLHDVNVALAPGSALGVIGASGSGKSTFARALVGLARPSRGVIRLDGASIDQWDSDALGRAVGYLPQDIEMFDGTIAENITRFDPEPNPEALLAAAQAAGVHEVVLRLPGGYDARVGSGGLGLSGGQRQRIALARALYGDPFLVVLDEPNSNLDVDGDRALSAAVQGVRARGGIVVVIAHRPSALAAVDRILVLGEGRVQLHGPRDDVLSKLNALTRRTPTRVA